MDKIREQLQVFVQRFGLLNADCAEGCCGAEVSLAQCYILNEINRRENASMQEVAEALGIDITTFSRQIKALEGKGLVNKTPDPADRRVNLLALTVRGGEVESKIGAQLDQYLSRIFSHLTDFEQDTVIKAIGLLNKAMQKAGSCC